MKMSFLKMKLNKDEVSNMRSHKFVGTDNSILSKYVINRYIGFIVNRIPRSVSPNMLTMCGFISMVMSLMLTVVVDPCLDNPPRWLPLMNFLLTGSYSVFDSLDGAQARRTGTGSPLGEILDHGVDSCCILIATITLVSSMRIGFSQELGILIVTMAIQFYLVLLEEKLTGIFILRKISGASEGIAFVLVLHLASFAHKLTLVKYLLSDEFLWPIRKASSLVLRRNNISAVSTIAVVVLTFNTAITVKSILSRIHTAKIIVLYKALCKVVLLSITFLFAYYALNEEDKHIQHLNILIFGQVFSANYVEEVYSHIVKGGTCTLSTILSMIYFITSIVLQLRTNVPGICRVLYAVSFLSSICYLTCVLRIIVTMMETLGVGFLLANEKKTE